jgi:hypothetical protein
VRYAFRRHPASRVSLNNDVANTGSFSISSNTIDEAAAASAPSAVDGATASAADD